MKSEALSQRIRKLEAKALAQKPDEYEEMRRRFLGRLNVEELRRLEGIVQRYQIEQIAPTEEEQQWLGELQANYGQIRHGHESL